MLFGHQNDTNNVGPATNGAASNDYLSSIGGNLGDAAAPLSSNQSPEVSNPVNSVTPSQNPFSAPATDSSSTTPVQSTVSDSPTVSDDHASSEDLMELKQQALDHLTPLVDHLEQTPEEKFRTTMMMIQSTDNQEMIKDALAAAKEIPDDKARAQALLDVINEINYFTQQAGATPSNQD